MVFSVEGRFLVLKLLYLFLYVCPLTFMQRIKTTVENKFANSGKFCSHIGKGKIVKLHNILHNFNHWKSFITQKESKYIHHQNTKHKILTTYNPTQATPLVSCPFPCSHAWACGLSLKSASPTILDWLDIALAWEVLDVLQVSLELVQSSSCIMLILKPETEPLVTLWTRCMSHHHQRNWSKRHRMVE